jgi:hypothetical protein
LHSKAGLARELVFCFIGSALKHLFHVLEIQDVSEGGFVLVVNATSVSVGVVGLEGSDAELGVVELLLQLFVFLLEALLLDGRHAPVVRDNDIVIAQVADGKPEFGVGMFGVKELTEHWNGNHLLKLLK